MKSAARNWPKPPVARAGLVGQGLTRDQMQSLEAWQRTVAGLEQFEQKGPAVDGPLRVTFTIRGNNANTDPPLEAYSGILTEQLRRLQIITREARISKAIIQWGDVKVGVQIEVEEI